MNTRYGHGYMKKALMLLIMALLMSGSAFARGDWRGGGFHGGFHGGFGDHRGFSHGGGFFWGPSWFWGPTIVIGDVPYYYYGGEYYTPRYGDMVAIEVPLEKSKPAVATPAAASAVTPVASPAVAPAVSTAASSATKVQSLNTAKPVGEAEESFTINVPNAKGEFTPVKLVKHDKGFIGPQGEFYPDHPTVDELKVLYGK